MKAYSLYLRERVVAAVYTDQPVSVIARVFSVSRATVQRWVRRDAGGKALAPCRQPEAPRPIHPFAEVTLEQFRVYLTGRLY